MKEFYLKSHRWGWMAMKRASAILKTFALLLFLVFTHQSVQAQCPTPNLLQFAHPATAATGLTPATLNTPVDANGTWGGHFVEVNVISGNKYKFSLVGSEDRMRAQFFGPSSATPNITFNRPEIDFDPILTLYDNSGSTGGNQLSGTVLAFNEDASATETMPELEFVATYTGVIYAAIDPQPGTAVGNTGTGAFSFTAMSNCSSISSDSTSLRVTYIPSAPALQSATKDSDTQITLTFSDNVLTNGGNPTDFTVTDGLGTTYPVSAQADGTAGDANIVLTVASLAAAAGDIKITYTNNNNEISDLTGVDKTSTDASGVTIDLDSSAPTLVSATLDSDTQITLTFSEAVQTNEGNPTDFTIVDAASTAFNVTAQADGTANDNQIVLTTDNTSAATLNLTITYTNNNNEISDFGSNSLATDGTGVSLGIFSLSDVTGPFYWEYQGGGASLPTGPNPAGLDAAVLPIEPQRFGSVTLGDLDGDNDLDFISGGNRGALYYFQNTGTPTAPNWEHKTGVIVSLDTIRIGVVQASNEVRPNLFDIDQDGDLDLIVGSRWDYPGQLKFNDIHIFLNTGTSTNPVFGEYVDDFRFGLVDQFFGPTSTQVAEIVSTSFVDLDGDNLTDMVAAGNDSARFYKNTGTATSPFYVPQDHIKNPFLTKAKGGTFEEMSFLAPTPRFADFDGDGDFDMYFGDEGGFVKVMENTGTATNAIFTTSAALGKPLDTKHGTFSALAIGDVNNDGIADIITTNFNPTEWYWYAGRTTVVNPIFLSATKDSDTQITITFDQNVQTNGTNATDFTVVDGLGTSFAVSAQADGTAGDTDIVLTVANLANAVGDLTVTYTNNNNEISDSETGINTANTGSKTIDLDSTVPTLVSATKDSDTQITVTLSEQVQTNGSNPTDFTVTDGIGANFAVSAQADGTAQDTDIVITVADLSTAAGDLKVTYTNNNNEISDFGENSLATDATGVSIDSDVAAPTLSSATKDSNTAITLTFSEPVQTNGTNPTDFTLVDGIGTNFAVTAQADGTANDTDLVLTVTDLAAASGDLTVTYTNNNNEVTDFGGNSLATNATGVSIDTDMSAPTMVSANMSSSTEITITFSESVSFEAVGVSAGFKVVDGLGTIYGVSSISDGTAKDDMLVLTVASLTNAVGDLKITFDASVPEDKVIDFGGNSLATNANGVNIDTDTTDPTMSSGVKDSDTQLTITFSEQVQIIGDDAGDFTVIDANSTPFVVSQLTDGTANDDKLILTVADLSSATGPLTVTYSQDCSTIADFGSNALQTDATGIDITLAPTITSVSVPSDGTVGIGGTLDFTVNFSDPVTITGAPTIDVTIGSKQVSATLNAAVTASATAFFSYTIVSGEEDTDGIEVGTALTLNGASIQDASNIDALIALNSVGGLTNVNVDGIAPAAPVFTSITDDTGSESDDLITNDQTLVIKGTAEANSRLAILVDGVGPFGGITITVDGDGNWEFDPVGEGTFTLTEGVHTYTATTEDAAGNESPVSTDFVVTVDLTAPAQPTIDLDASTDLGISNTDNLTSGGALTLKGTAEANSSITLALVDENDAPLAGAAPISITADGDGNWTYSESDGGFSNVFRVVALAQDLAGNSSVQSETLTFTYDNDLTISSSSPADDEVDVLPNANLTITFDKNVIKGTGNIEIIQSSDDAVQQTIDITGDNVTISGATVTIDPANNILPSNTEFYVNIDAGTFENEAGADFSGISDKTTWTFTTIAASAVSSVGIPADGGHAIGNELDFTLSMSLPITVTGGTPSIPITIGASTVQATMVGTANNTNTLTFRYTVQEDDLDADGISVGAAMALNGATMQDEFDVDAILTLNNVANSTGVIVDGVRPLPAVVAAINQDSNISGDFITNDNTLEFLGAPVVLSTDNNLEGIGQVNSDLVEGDVLEFFIDGVSIGTGPVVINDGFDIFATVLDHTGTVLADGSYTLSITSTDSLGNQTTSDALPDEAAMFVQPLIIDTSAPAAPTVDLVASSDLGISSTDDLTSDATPTFEGTAEAMTTVAVFVDGTSVGTTTADENGDWTFTPTTDLSDATLAVTAKATDTAGNVSDASSTLTVTVDTSILVSTTSPTDKEVDVLPNANLTIIFDKNVVKGSGNITVKQVSDDTVIETIDVTGSNVSVSGATVTIDPVDNILPPGTEFYVNIDAGAFENEAGEAYAGLSSKTDWSFTIIAASVVSQVTVPANGGHAIGDDLDFTVSMVLPVSVVGGTPSIPVTIGESTVQANMVGTATNASTLTFRYTVLEDDLDADGISVGATMALNGATMQDEFDVDAILTLNNVANSTAVIVDGVRPLPALVAAINLDSNSDGDFTTNDNTLEFLGIQVLLDGNNDLTSVDGEDGDLVEGDVLEFFIDGTSIGTAPVVSNDGFADFAAILDHTGTVLADGTYTLSITVIDSLGNSTASSALPAEAAAFVQPLIVDTSAPAPPTVDLVASSDLGISSTDNLTSDASPTFEGIAEAGTTVEIFTDGTSIGTTTADDNGDWTFTPSTDLTDATLAVTAKATDTAGNVSDARSMLTVTVDTSILVSSTSPADDEVDVLPNANLTITFDKNVMKGTGNIQIIQSSNDAVQQTIDVTGGNVTVDGATVTINPPANILPPDTEFYVNIDAGAFENEAGAAYAGLSSKTDWSFTIIAASVVTSVDVPADGTYNIGDNLDFTVNMVLPVSITGTATIPVTIGSSTVNATQVGTVSNSSSILFRYTVVEDELDADGIAVGAAINLNGGTMQDEFSVDAILDLNGVGATTAVLVDGIKPTPTISATAVDLVNGTFSATITYDEAVENVEATDLTVVNGTASNLMNTMTGTTWTVDITPTADGTVSLSLAANTANDLAGNDSKASNSISRDFDGTAPEVISVNRSDSNPLNTGVTSADFRVIFSEAVTGLDMSDLELVLTGTATGMLNSLTPVDATTYDVNVNGIGGQGTIGLNVKDDDSIIDAATNPLAAAFTGQVYTTNFIPTNLALSSTAYDENNALDAVLAAISTTDADAGDTHTYSLVAGEGDADNGFFIVDGTDLKTNNLSLNFEFKSSFTIRLQTDDSKGGIFQKAFALSVTDINEVPQQISLSNNTITESDEAQDVGIFMTLDPDAGDSFTYAFVEGEQDAHNAEFIINGNTLSTNGGTNFEAGATRDIRVRVTDSGGLTFDWAFTIIIEEVTIEPLREYETNVPGGAVTNIFSPNGDGVNETWVIQDLLDNPINEVKVYAQGGKLIFSQINYQNDWDGTFKGDPIPPGTYYYEVNVYNGESIIRGFLTIIRN